MAIKFIVCSSGLVLRTGLELDQAALEPRVQAGLPQSIAMTEVEFKAGDSLQKTESQQEGGGRL